MGKNGKQKKTGVDWINSALWDERAKDDIPRLKEQGYSDDYIEGFYTGTLIMMACPEWLVDMKVKKVREILGVK